ncbi:MAG: TIGR00730 family Rossman fold protein [Actinomycetota bacterium]
MRICVFCGSSNDSAPAFTKVAVEVGGALASRGIGLVYGGASVGTMGALADAALAGGGEVVGVIPGSMTGPEVAHEGLTELHVVEGMHERKALMSALSDGCLALPGGAGTFDELFEAWTWRNIGLHDKPVGVLDAEGFYDPLLEQLDRMEQSGFLRRAHRETLIVGVEAGELLDRVVEAVRTGG